MLVVMFVLGTGMSVIADKPYKCWAGVALAVVAASLYAWRFFP